MNNTATTTSDTTTSQPAENELIIKVCPRWVYFEGSAAQLQAEGLIPDGFEWPRADDKKSWRTNDLEICLIRTRPHGHKGPMRSWFELDNWSIRINAVDRSWEASQRREIERKAEELRREIYRLSPSGQIESHARSIRFWAAKDDQAFQAFKAIFLPESKKPRRKAKVQAQAQGEQQ